MLSWPLDSLLWTAVSALQNVVAVIVLVAIGYAFFRRLVTRPARLTYTTDALVILALIGGVVATELLAQAFEFARYGDQPGAFVASALAVPFRSILRPGGVETGFISNPVEETRLRSRDRQRAAAEAIAAGVREFADGRRRVARFP